MATQVSALNDSKETEFAIDLFKDEANKIIVELQGVGLMQFHGPDGKQYPMSPDYYGSYIGAPGWYPIPQKTSQ